MRSTVFFLLATSLTVSLTTGCQDNWAGGGAANDDWEIQNRQYQEQLDVADDQIERYEKLQERNEEHADRLGQLLDRWDEQADRYDKILDKWEAQPAPPLQPADS